MLQTPELSNYNDISALQSLKSASKKDSREGIRAVAEQFESVFISMMLKSMREANKGFSEGNLLSSNETEFYQEMFDSQIAVSLAGQQGGGIGLADVIERQILESKGFEVEGAAPVKAMTLSDYERKTFPSLDINRLQNAVERVDEVVEQRSPNTLDPTGDDQGDAASVTSPRHVLPTEFESPQHFVESLYPVALEVEAQSGISARLMVAQSALETGWGQHPIRKEGGENSFNLFGIKANHGWSGETADIVTTEFHQGIPLKQRDSFRAYESYRDSFHDYAQFLKSNPRYESALAVRDDPIEFARALQASGYATDPRYADKIETIIQSRLSGDELGR